MSEHYPLQELGNDERHYEGSCFCGAVEFEVYGAAVVMGYCHCASCRRWSASPINAFTLWRPDALKITKGAENLGTYNKTSRSLRSWCTICGGHVFTDHPPFELVDVYAASIPAYPFEPSVHVHYGEAELRIHDGLQKFRDLPQEMGGSGELGEE